jgi:hypothetical protein
LLTNLAGALAEGAAFAAGFLIGAFAAASFFSGWAFAATGFVWSATGVTVEPAGAACALTAVPDAAIAAGGAFGGWLSGMVKDVALSCGLAEVGAKAAVKARIAGTTRRVAGVKLRSFIELQLSFSPPELSQGIRFKHINHSLSTPSRFCAM